MPKGVVYWVQNANLEKKLKWCIRWSDQKTTISFYVNVTRAEVYDESLLLIEDDENLVSVFNIHCPVKDMRSLWQVVLKKPGRHCRQSRSI